MNLEEITIKRTVGNSELLPMITERDGVPVTTSRAVAEQFGKQHKDVIRAIENTIATLQGTEDSEDFNRRNFAPVKYEDAKGEARPAYILTRDGFTLLAMGFTGARAMQFKLAYINAFNRMEALLRGGSVGDVEALQRRVEALEKAIAPRPVALEPAPACTAADELSAIFLQAIQQAIDSGLYYIRPKYKRMVVPDGMTPFGVYDRYEICLLSRLAYNIYAAAVSNPVPIKKLWFALDMAGTTIPLQEVRSVKITPGKHQGLIGLSRNRLRIP